MDTADPIADPAAAGFADSLPPPLSATADGVTVHAGASPAALAAALDALFANGRCLSGLDYDALAGLLYGGAGAPAAGAPVRVAGGVAPFTDARRALYRSLKADAGHADYFFEPVFMGEDPQPVRLSLDEFVAALWLMGVRYGIDSAAVARAIASGKVERVRVASRLEPEPGADAAIVEVCADLHRNDAPRQLPDGRLDLMSFQNRFPQIAKGMRLLKKVPARAGRPGRELDGRAIAPPPAADADLRPLAGPGTRVETTDEGEFLVATAGGFLCVDAASGELSVSDKIISREGVSGRTTGNLHLDGDYEEFGEIQEKRVVEGENITIHADVFGHVASRGGTVLLNRNLVGGSATNACGDIHVKGVASSAVLQATQGEVVLSRAENCVVSGRRVVIDHAVNCEVLADELSIRKAEGCALAARVVEVGAAGPRRQVDMAVYALVPDTARMDEVLAQLEQRVAAFARQVDDTRAGMDSLSARPEVRKYMLLASKIRSKEVVLTPAQVPQFQKMADLVGPELRAIGKLSLALKGAQAERDEGTALIAQLAGQRKAAAVSAAVRIEQVDGDTTVRTLRYNPDGSCPYQMPARDIKARLRGAPPGEPLFSGCDGQVLWRS